MVSVKIDTEFIKLDQFFEMGRIGSNGADAKA